jgi:preprotein translocase subunit SecD
MKAVFQLLLACVAFNCVGDVSADKPLDAPRVKVEFRRAESKPAAGLIEATVEGSKQKVYLHQTAAATEQDIAEARVAEDSQQHPAVEIRFTEEGGKKIAKLTEQQKDKPIAILVNGKVISAPIVRSTISKRAMITGNFTKEEVEKLVKGINGK